MAKEETKSGKASKNSSKTARVLGLLTTPPGEEGSAQPRESMPEHELPHPGMAADDRLVEAEVRSALNQALLEEPEEPEPTVRAYSAAPLTAEEPEQAPAAPEQTPEEPEPQMPEEQTPSGEPEAQAAKGELAVDLMDALGPKSRLEPEIYCFNITKALVEAKVDKYIKLFGLCSCDRCRIDVIALALSNLPPKYVVAREHEMVPMLSMFETKYNAAIVSQVMNACKIVMEHPRHHG